MTQKQIPPVIAMALRKRLDHMFRDLRLAEDALNRFGGHESCAVIDALVRAKGELSIADVSLRHVIPDDALYAPPETL